MLVVAWLTAGTIFLRPITAYRMLTSGDSIIYTYMIFPQRPVALGGSVDRPEKTNTGLNARAIDFARIGLVFLNQGYWNGQQIISQQWIGESTMPNPSDH